jgi:MFS family permease
VASERTTRQVARGQARVPPSSRQRAFWFVAYTFVVAMLGGTLPIPLYVIYQGRWGFSEGMLTVIFAVYAAGTLFALLLFGELSDRIGRRRMLSAVLVLAALSSVVFVLAQGVAWLLVARVISGLSVGLCTGTAAAALSELEPQADNRRAALVSTASNMGGLGLGSLVAGLFAEYAPRPTILVYIFFIVLLVPAAFGLLATPETVNPHERGLSLRPQRLRVPAGIRPAFALLAAAVFCAFALLGLFSSLVPSFLGDQLREANHAVAGAVVFLVFATAAAVQLVLRGRMENHRAMGAGLVLLAAGLVLLLISMSIPSFVWFLIGTVCCGVGVGLSFMGSLAQVNSLAPPDHRGEVLSSYFAVAYVGLTIPVIGLGVASDYVGAFVATLAFAVVVGVLALIVAALNARPTPR